MSRTKKILLGLAALVAPVAVAAGLQSLQPAGAPVPTETPSVAGLASSGYNAGIYSAYYHQSTDPLVKGGVIEISWRQIETSPGVYNWSIIDSNLGQVQAGKSVSLRVLVRCADVIYDDGAPAGDGLRDDCAPTWYANATYAPITVSVPDSCLDDFANVSADKVKATKGKRLNYLNAEVKNRMQLLVSAIGARYENNATLTHVEVGAGYAGEWNPYVGTKPCDKDAEYAAYTAAYTPEAWRDYTLQLIDWYNAAFPLTPKVMLISGSYTPGYRSTIVKKALDQGWGLLTTSTTSRRDDNPGRAEGFCYWNYITDPSFTYTSGRASSGYMTDWVPVQDNYQIAPMSAELRWEKDYSVTKMDNASYTWWVILNALNMHVDVLQVYGEQLVYPDALNWFNRYAGLSAAQAPEAYVVFRSYYENILCPYTLNFTYYANTELEERVVTDYDKQQSAWNYNAQSVSSNVGPAGDWRSYFNREIREGATDTMRIDIDNSYAYNGNWTGTPTITLTFLDFGTDTIRVNWDCTTGVCYTDTTKTNTNAWRTVNISATNAVFKDLLGAQYGGFDVSVGLGSASSGVNHETLHMVKVYVQKSAATPTPTSSANTATPTRTPTPGLGPTNTPTRTPTATATYDPDVPTSTPTPSAPTATPTPKPSWWLAGGINPANVVAVYQPMGAPTYNDSLINLANPGTYNAYAGSAPAWDTGTGWDGTGNKYLKTGILAQRGWSFIFRYTGNIAFGSNNGSTGFGTAGGGANGIWYGTAFYPAISGGSTIGTAGSGSTAQAYKDGVAVDTPGGNWPSGNSLELYMIGLNWYGGPGFYSTGKLQGAAIYNTTLTSGQMAALHTELMNLTTWPTPTPPVTATPTPTATPDNSTPTRTPTPSRTPTRTPTATPTVTPTPFQTLTINELIRGVDPLIYGNGNWVELYCSTGVCDISGYTLESDVTGARFAIPDGTVIDAASSPDPTQPVYGFLAISQTEIQRRCQCGWLIPDAGWVKLYDENLNLVDKLWVQGAAGSTSRWPNGNPAVYYSTSAISPGTTNRLSSSTGPLNTPTVTPTPTRTPTPTP